MSASKRRQRMRAMRPHAHDPWKHNEVVARRRAYRRWALAVAEHARQLRALGRGSVTAAAAIRRLAGLPLAAPDTTAADLRRTYFGEDDE